MAVYKLDEELYDCPVEALSTILGKKWVAIIIWNLQHDKLRFGQLHRLADGCTKKMLSQQLELLIENEIVMKEKIKVNNTVESTYYLSEAGLKLLPIMEMMMKWSQLNLSCK